MKHRRPVQRQQRPRGQARRQPQTSGPLAGALGAESDGEERPEGAPKRLIGLWPASAFDGLERYQLMPETWPAAYGPPLRRSGRLFYYPDKVAGGPGIYPKEGNFVADLGEGVYSDETGLHLLIAFAVENTDARRNLIGAYRYSHTAYELRYWSGKLQWYRNAEWGPGDIEAEIELPAGSYVAHVHLKGFEPGPNVLEVYPATGGDVIRRDFEATPGGSAVSSYDRIHVGWGRIGSPEGLYIGTAAATRRLTQTELLWLLGYFREQHSGMQSLPEAPGGGLSWWWLVALAAGGTFAWAASGDEKEKQQKNKKQQTKKKNATAK